MKSSNTPMYWHTQQKRVREVARRSSQEARVFCLLRLRRWKTFNNVMCLDCQWKGVRSVNKWYLQKADYGAHPNRQVHAYSSQ